MRMASNTPRSFPRRRESSSDRKMQSWVPASAGTSGSGPTAHKAAAETENWLTHLGDERRYSPKTLEAYRRDVRQFLEFLTQHFGGAPALKDLARLKPAAVRAFWAARRAAGIGSRSLMRTLAGIRGFARYLERNGKGKVGALAAVRAPKIGKTLPRPLPVAAARRGAHPDISARHGGGAWASVGE